MHDKERGEEGGLLSLESGGGGGGGGVKGTTQAKPDTERIKKRNRESGVSAS